MSIYTFNRGNWEEGSPLPEWNDNETQEDYLNRLGYTTRTATFGHNDGGCIQVYEHSANPSFFAAVSPGGNTCFEVFLPDFPSMMVFIKDYAPAIASEATNVSAQQTLSLLEKLFQVQHGHAAYSICQQCDPTGWAAMQRLRKQG